MTSPSQESGIRLEAQLAELASKNPGAHWLLDEYRSTEKHANTALNYVLQHAPHAGYFLPKTVKVEIGPTRLMQAYAARDSRGAPLIYVNSGLRFFLIMLNYSLVRATFKSAALGGQSMSATLFAVVNGSWPMGVNLLSEMDGMREHSEDEMYFVTAWFPSQMFFVVAHEFVHHILWSGQGDAAQVRKVHLLDGREIEVYRPSLEDELKADEMAFDIWAELDLTLSDGFHAFTAGGLGALLGYSRILEQYIQSEPISAEAGLPPVDRYQRLSEWFYNTGRIPSLQAMEETWSVTEIITKPCMEAREKLQRQSAED